MQRNEFGERDGRIADTPHSLSKMLRRIGLRVMQRDGFSSIRSLLDHPYIIGRASTLCDVYEIARGGGGNNKRRFELGAFPDGRTVAIRDARGRPPGRGLPPGALPLAGDVGYFSHGTSMKSARCISEHGLNSGDRIHIHF